MSDYQIDDETVSYLLGNLDLLPPKLAAQLEPLRAQLPTTEPDREYLVKDKDGDIWRWEDRQSAWHCITEISAYTRWHNLVANHGPVTLYGEVS